MQIRPICNRKIQMSHNIKPQQVPVQNGNIVYTNTPISFGFLNQFEISRGVLDFIDKEHLDKAHLEQILNYRVNRITEGDIKTNVKYKESDNLYHFGSMLEDDLRSINNHEKILTKDLIVSLENVLKKQPKPCGEKINDYIEYESIKIKREFIQEMLSRLQECNPDSNVYEEFKCFGDFTDEVATAVYQKRSERYDEYIDSIREKISYSDDEEIEVFDVEEELEKMLPEDRKNFILRYGDNINKMCENYLADRGSADGIAIPKYSNLDTAILQTLPRYSSLDCKRRKQGIFEIEPVYRWLRIEDVESFLKQFKIGEEYSYPASQSCSKDYECAEHVHFTDMNPRLNVKFIIHPKGKTSKAYDFQSINCNRDGKYYDTFEPLYRKAEVIYPANTKFRVLGIHRDFVYNTKANSEYYGRYILDKYRTLIDLQEI